MSSTAAKYLCNNQIRSNFVHLIDETGKSHGITHINDAISKARSVGLDLVQVSIDNSSKPTCKIMNFGKFKYDLSKQKQSTKHKVKELFITSCIGKHDLETKLNKLKEFLDKKYTVIFGVKFKTQRERRNPDQLKEQIRTILNGMGKEYSEEDFSISADKVSINLK